MPFSLYLHEQIQVQVSGCSPGQSSRARLETDENLFLEEKEGYSLILYCREWEVLLIASYPLEYEFSSVLYHHQGFNSFSFLLKGQLKNNLLNTGDSIYCWHVGLSQLW